MAPSVNWLTRVVTVPISDLTLVSGTLRALDTNTFRLDLKEIEASVEGAPYPDIHSHSTEVTVAGTTFARQIQIINGYTVEFEDGQYAVRLDGSNNNIFDEGVIVRNQVSVIPTNSAGLQTVNTGATVVEAPPESHVSLGYDNAGTVTVTAWLTRDGAPITSGLVSASVTLHEPDGTLLGSGSSVAFDSNGVSSFTISATLVANTAYYCVATVTDGSGPVVDVRGTPTGA